VDSLEKCLNMIEGYFSVHNFFDGENTFLDWVVLLSLLKVFMNLFLEGLDPFTNIAT
jgi:hypothetical protein